LAGDSIGAQHGVDGSAGNGVVRFFEDAIAAFGVARTSRGFVLKRKASTFMEQYKREPL
jgi:hypothetical protein